MSTRRETAIAALASVFLLFGGAYLAASAQTADETKGPAGGERLGLGERPNEELIKAWDIDISPDGANLPEGNGSVAEGRKIFADTCAVCHGEKGVEGPMDRLVGGQGTLATDSPVKTVGSYWPYATTLYDYIHRAMPFDNPQSLTPHEVYAVAAYVLNLNGVVPDDAVLDAKSLPKVEMPNHDSFEQMDTVTRTDSQACMDDCEPFALGTDTTSPETIDEEQVQ